MKNCSECIHWYSTGLEDYQGYCMASVICVNSKNKPRFMHKDEAKPIPGIMKIGGEDKIRGRNVVSDENIVKAHQNRQRHTPIYPDMRTLTDESKKLLRRRK